MLYNLMRFLYVAPSGLMDFNGKAEIAVKN